MFPWSTATNALDLDHVLPYLSEARGGPPGQTRIDKLSPNARTEHRAITYGGWQRRLPELGTMLYRAPHGTLLLTNHTGTHDLGYGDFAHAIWTLAERDQQDETPRPSAGRPVATCCGFGT
jgi:hypothetical protein